jgi:hypothetical protein
MANLSPLFGGKAEVGFRGREVRWDPKRTESQHHASFFRCR